MSSILKVEDLNVSYGAINALKGVTFDVEEGSIVSLIGANGAGKSTLLNSIVSLVPHNHGSISFQGENLKKYNTADIMKKGISLVPEGRHVFTDLTVE